MKPGTIWIGVVVGLLGMSVAIQATLLIVASGDPSFALEPDYEAKADNWDDYKRQQQRSDELGWQLDLRTAATSVPGQVDVELTVLDDQGQPIDGAMVTVIGFHNARLRDLQSWTFSGVGDGIYQRTLTMRRAGIWEFRISVEKDGDLAQKRVRKSVLIEAPRAAG